MKKSYEKPDAAVISLNIEEEILSDPSANPGIGKASGIIGD